jgi:hypothetical protein
MVACSSSLSLYPRRCSSACFPCAQARALLLCRELQLGSLPYRAPTRALRSVAACSRANSLAAVPCPLSSAARSTGCVSLRSEAPSFVWTATTCAKALLLLLEASRRNIWQRVEAPVHRRCFAVSDVVPFVPFVDFLFTTTPSSPAVPRMSCSSD